MRINFIHFTIVQKLLALFAIAALILIVIAFNGYYSIDNNKRNITYIKDYQLPIFELHNTNLYIIKGIMNKFSDAAITNELEILQSSMKEKEALLQNLKQLKEYGVDVTLQQNLFANYFDYVYIITYEFIANEKFFGADEVRKIQELSNEMLQEFDNAGTRAKENLHHSLFDITQDSKKYFDTSLFISTSGILMMILAGVLIYFNIHKRFSSVIESLAKLVQEKENFSQRLHDESKDEISQLIMLFNSLSSRLEYENDTLQDRIKEEVEKNNKQYQQLVKQSRLAQMGEMLSMIAHQWRQPLGAISATTMNMSVQAQLNKLTPENAKELIAKINKYVEFLNQTIEDFRNFFKPNKEKVQTNFDQLVKEVLYIIGTSIEAKQINLELKFDCNENFISFPNEIKQVILNLLKNAEDALLEKKVENPYIKIHSYCIDDLVVLEVKDNAGGISEEIIENIFDPYFSTKLDKNGTGLGLYMSKTIIDEHCDGILEVSNDDFGAVFKISIKGGSDG